MEPWQEVNVLARRIEAGELDKFLAQVGQAVSRRLVKLAEIEAVSANPPLSRSTASINRFGKDRAAGRVQDNQAKLVWSPGDIARVGVTAPWRIQDLVVKVLRVNQTTLWVRAVAPNRPDRITGYQWFQGFKVEVRHALLIVEPDTNITRIAAKIPLPGPRLQIGKKGVFIQEDVVLAGTRIANCNSTPVGTGIDVKA